MKPGREIDPRPLAWITGAGGLIGSTFVRTARELAPGWRLAPWVRPELDFTDPAAVDRQFAAQRPALVIHCAALSKSPACQAHPECAWRINTEATRHLSALCADIPLVFFSTDLVFDGRQGDYREGDAPNPMSVYAETKVAAEQAVLRHRRHLVVRTSLNAGVSPGGDRAFNEQMRRAWEGGRTLELFTDEFRSPISAAATVRAVWGLVACQAAGLCHVAGAQRLSRWQIGEWVARSLPGVIARMKPASIRDYPGPPRPPDTSLNCQRAQSLLGRPLPGLAEWLTPDPAVLWHHGS